MRVAVFGSGGVGGYFGGRLAQSGLEVIFIARGEHLEAIRSSGLRVDSLKGDFIIYPAQATNDPVEVGVVDAVLVGVKAWQVAEAARAMKPMLGDQTMVVPLQNGVDAPGELSSVLGARPVLGGLCKISSLIAGPGHIRHVGLEPYIAFGELEDGHSPRSERLQAAFATAGVWAEVPANIQAAMWEKFLFITAISGVGSVTRVPVGVMRSLPETRQMLEQVMQEIYNVALRRNVALAEDIISNTMAFIDGLPAGATPSLMRDILEGKPSELVYQNGAVVRMGFEVGEPTPVNAFIYASLLPQEQQARRELPD